MSPIDRIKKNKLFGKKNSNEKGRKEINLDLTKSPTNSTQRINNKAENVTDPNNSLKSRSYMFKEKYLNFNSTDNNKDTKLDIEKFKNKIKYQFNWCSPNKSFSNHPTNNLLNTSSNNQKIIDQNESYAVKATKKRFPFEKSNTNSTRVLNQNKMLCNKKTILVNSPDSP